MSHTFRTFSLVVLSFCLVLLFGCSTAVDPAASEKEVRQKTDEMVEAWRLNDEGWLERNAANEYLITSQSLEVVNKDQIIEYMSGAEEDPDPGTAEIDEWQTIAAGDTFISLYKLSWTFDSGKSNVVLVTDVWSRDAAQWKLLTQHVSRISLTGPADSDAGEE